MLAPERTFWEKATAVHAEINWSEAQPAARRPRWRRFSRHLYDLVMLDRHGIATRAIAAGEILDAVRRNKTQMFQQPQAAKMDEARPGSFRLVPTGSIEKALRDDYRLMEEMIFGAAPTFGTVLRVLKDIERRINS